MVEWKTIGEISTIIRGNRVTKSDLIEDGQYPVISGGVSPLGYIDKYNRESNTITIAQYGSAGYVDLQKEQFWANDVCYSVYPQDNVLNMYLYYYLKNKQREIYSLRTNAVPAHLPQKELASVEIPIPSLSEQSRIVSILDTFTASIENLKEQIAERRKQYEYEREKLFSESSSTKLIGELTKVFSCPRVYKDQWQDSGIPFWRSSDVMSYHNKVSNPRGEVYISESLYNELSKKTDRIEEGDILVTGGGSIGVPYLKKDNNPLFVKDADLLCIKKCKAIIPSYLYHYFLSTDFKLYLNKITHDATIAHYTIGQIIDTPIPVPSLSEQSRIVSILDTFEASIANLEAQLELRQKQYEYYRNQLLTFE